jgi:hypothetical protein
MPKNIVAREADKPTAVEFINSLKLVYKFKLDSDKYQIQGQQYFLLLAIQELYRNKY